MNSPHTYVYPNVTFSISAYVGRKTRRWRVLTTKGIWLGAIAWNSGRHEYCFLMLNSVKSVTSNQLKDIWMFLEHQNIV